MWMTCEVLVVFETSRLIVLRYFTLYLPTNSGGTSDRVQMNIKNNKIFKLKLAQGLKNAESP